MWLPQWFNININSLVAFLLFQTGSYDFNSDINNITSSLAAEGITTLDDWFENAPAVEMNEDVVGLGSYGKTLTVLFTNEALENEDEDEYEWW